MTENHPSNVASAFEILLEEVEIEIELVNRCGARAFEGREYEKAREALERAGSLTAFRDKAMALRQEWDALAAKSAAEEDAATQAERRNLGRLRKGLRTSEARYYLPILQVLDKMGGAGKVAEVLERVQTQMKAVLKPVDFEPLASEPEHPRWRNAAQWARNSMVREGLLKADSPRGVWEISGRGPARLAKG